MEKATEAVTKNSFVLDRAILKMARDKVRLGIYQLIIIRESWKCVTRKLRKPFFCLMLCDSMLVNYDRWIFMCVIQVMKMTMGNYPAPLKILEVVRTGLVEGHEKGLQHESKVRRRGRIR